MIDDSNNTAVITSSLSRQFSSFEDFVLFRCSEVVDLSITQLSFIQFLYVFHEIYYFNFFDCFNLSYSSKLRQLVLYFDVISVSKKEEKIVQEIVLATTAIYTYMCMAKVVSEIELISFYGVATPHRYGT